MVQKGLTQNTVSTFHKNAGKSPSMTVRFMCNRATKLCEGDHVFVDGTLKTNTYLSAVALREGGT